MLFWLRREGVRFSLASLATSKCGEMPRKRMFIFLKSSWDLKDSSDAEISRVSIADVSGMQSQKNNSAREG